MRIIEPNELFSVYRVICLEDKCSKLFEINDFDIFIKECRKEYCSYEQYHHQGLKYSAKKKSLVHKPYHLYFECPICEAHSDVTIQIVKRLDMLNNTVFPTYKGYLEVEETRKNIKDNRILCP
jgi:hypothetical protein